MSAHRFFFLTVLICFAAAAQQPLEISRLSGNFYIYTTYKAFQGNPFPSSGMYVVTDDGVVLLDTPWDETQFQPLLDSIQKRHSQKVMLCVAAHYHDDRTAGLGYFKNKGISTYTSKQTFDLCREHGEKQAAFYFKKDTVFDIGGYRFETYYPGPGHTRDNIVIWFPKEKILYGGCFIKSTEDQGLGNIADADVKAWPRSVRKMMKRFPDPSFVIPGHFDWTDNRSPQHTLSLLKEK